MFAGLFISEVVYPLSGALGDSENTKCWSLSVPSNNPAHRYYMATDPVTGQLYISDTNSRRIYRPKVLTATKELLQNSEVVAGTGEHCLPFDEARCGDGGKATEALLMGPKGTL